ncbi:MAG: PKD domain-containing protein [Nitrososphaeraceae archaeon]
MKKNLIPFVSLTISILFLLIFTNINNSPSTFIIFNNLSPILKEIDAKPIAIENIAGSDKTGKVSCSVDGKVLNFGYKVQKGEKVTVDDQTCKANGIGNNIEFTGPNGEVKQVNNERDLTQLFGISGGPSLPDKAAADKAAADKTPQTPTPKLNKPPIVKLGTFPKVVKENTTVTLNAAASTDPEDSKNFLKFQWAQSAGVPIKKFLTKVDTPILRFVLPEVAPAGGSITMQLIVTDSKGESSISKSPIFISIQNVNKPPIASISKITPKNENSTVTLTASGSKDPDGEPLKFVWRQITQKPKVTLENNQSAVASFVAPNVQKDTKMQFSVNVLDGNKINGKANKTVNVLIKQVNLPPVADAGKNFVANESSIVTLNGNKTKDPDRLDKLKYLWTQVAGNLVIDIKNEKTIKPSFKVPFVKQNNSLYAFKLTVTDPKGLNSSDTVNMTVRKISNITVNPPNAQVVQNLIVQEGKNATLSAANSTDPDIKEKLTFQWKQIAGQPVVDLRKANYAIAEFVAPVVEENTTLKFNVTATNKKGLNDTATTFVKIANIPEQGFPIIYGLIAGVGAAGAAAAVIVYKFFMRRPSGPGRAI